MKRQDLAVLLQGINLPGLAAEPLPPANVHPAVAPPQHQGAAHTYHLQQITAGRAKTKRWATCAAPTPPPAVRPRLAAQRQLFPAVNVPSAALGVPTPIPIMPRNTPIVPHPTHIAFRPAAISTALFVSQAPGMRLPSAPSPLMVPQALHFVPPSSCTTHIRPAPGPAPRAYQRRVEANKCWKCGQNRTAQTGHSHYKGTVY